MNLNEQAFAQALVLAGELDDRQRALLRVMCRSACAALSVRLRPEMTPEDCGMDFVYAAGLMALAAMNEGGEMASMTQFTVGDVSLRRGAGENGPECLRKQALAMMAPYLRDGFSFRGV